MRTVIEERNGILVLRTVPLELVEETKNTAPSWAKKARKKRQRKERISRAAGWLLVKGWPILTAVAVASGFGALIGGVLRHVW